MKDHTAFNGKIGVLTYQAPHRKTWDTLALLRAKGYTQVEVYATPMRYTKKFVPLYDHRPILPDLEYLQFELTTQEICEHFGYVYTEIPDYEELRDAQPDVYLVCGAGLLPENLIKDKTVINSHPGYIPLVRGLDALKWAIIEDLPIGVTSHVIGDEVDAGEVIQRVKVPIYEHDTFYEVAQRQYDIEIYLLVGALQHLGEEHTYYPAGDHAQHRRMPREFEASLPEAFERYKEQHLTIL